MSTEHPEPFPWHLGVYDAHCHPTDTMARLSSIPAMKARALTVMATRSEDQDLVLSVAATHGVKSPDPSTWSRDECIVPCFGWHPWFAHQLYFDTDPEYTQESTQEDETPSPRPLTGTQKTSHYATTLSPSRSSPSETDISTFAALPDPIPITPLLASIRANLLAHPHALVGEIGLDRSFRIPFAWDSSAWSQRDSSLTPGGREGRRLTPFRCAPAHQKRVLAAQLALAAELGRGVSVHGVQAHGLLHEALAETWKGFEKEVLSKRERKRRGVDHPSVAGGTQGSSTPQSGQDDDQQQQQQEKTPLPYPPRICLHSYSGTPANFKLYTAPSIPARIFASFSTAINLGDAVDGETPAAFEDMIRAVPDHMLLVESDLHTAGDEMDRRLEDIVRRVCGIKGWGLEEGVERLGRNWRAFVFGEGEGEER